MTTLWDTTGTAVVKALAAERRLAGAVSSGLALTLVVVVDEKRVAEAEVAATRAAAQHPCRLLVVVRRRPDAPEPRLDAEILIGGRLGPGEAVVMRMYGRLALHAESVILPLLAPDAPVVTWWNGEPPHLIAHDPLGVFADRRVTDSSLGSDALLALRQRAADYSPGDTDLTWTRTTQWRALCASAFDAAEDSPTAARVAGQAGNASRELIAGWLQSRLGLAVTIDGAFSEAYGDHGFTLVIDSDQTYLAKHHHFESIDTAIDGGADIVPEIQNLRKHARTIRVGDTRRGAELREEIAALEQLVAAYRDRLIDPPAT